MKKYDNINVMRSTKIVVPLVLRKCPSDYEDINNYIDILGDAHFQKNCYIKSQFIHSITFSRTIKQTEIYWNVEIIVLEVLNEDAAITIVRDLCEIINTHCLQEFHSFHNFGFKGFTFYEMDVKRYYGEDETEFFDAEINRYCGYVECKVTSSISSNVFCLPSAETKKTPLWTKLNIALIKAMSSNDVISRYILLYYLFEIIYDTDAYKQIALPKSKNYCNTQRNVILYTYLTQTGVTSYHSSGKRIPLEADTLKDIILVRNRIAHQADTTKVFTTMYNHLLPILQELLSTIQ